MRKDNDSDVLYEKVPASFPKQFSLNGALWKFLNLRATSSAAAGPKLIATGKKNDADKEWQTFSEALTKCLRMALLILTKKEQLNVEEQLLTFDVFSFLSTLSFVMHAGNEKIA